MGFYYIINNDSDNEQKVFKNWNEMAEYFEIKDYGPLGDALEKGTPIQKNGKNWYIDIFIH